MLVCPPGGIACRRRRLCLRRGAGAETGRPDAAGHRPGLAIAAAAGRCLRRRGDAAGATIVYLQGHSNWDTAFDSIVDAFKSLNEYLAKQGIKPIGPAMTIYTKTDDSGFDFRAALPVAEPPKDPPKGDIAVGPAPSGKALKFVHRGSYDAMDSTYEAITNYLDDKQLEAKDLFIEEYVSDPVTTDPDKLVVNVLVPIK